VSADEPGLSFGSAAAAYERGRPGWPPELLDELPLPPGSRVLDLAAGTGKLTRLLAQRYRVVAVEPDPGMRALLSQVTDCYLEGTAEAIPLEDAAVHGVFVAEAFHWFDAGRALAEIARVLRPGGVLALLWNRWDPGDYVLPEGVLPPFSTPKHGLFLTGEWRRPFAAAPFEPLHEVEAPQEREVPREELLAYFASISPVTALPPGERAEALRRVAAVLDRPSYRRRWRTCLYWTRRAD
jgi:ubiquinone/menaquinone biosynthesis C-methylase UbiE